MELIEVFKFYAVPAVYFIVFVLGITLVRYAKNVYQQNKK